MNILKRILIGFMSPAPYFADEYIEQLKRHEGFRSKPYLDTVGKLTIGYGRNLDDVGISEEEAELMLYADINKARNSLINNLPWVEDLPQEKQAALINMTFNMGIYGLLTFRKMLANLKNGNYERAAAEVLDSKYAEQVGYRAREIAAMIRNA